MTRTYRLERAQRVERPLDEVFEFFADAAKSSPSAGSCGRRSGGREVSTTVIFVVVGVASALVAAYVVSLGIATRNDEVQRARGTGALGLRTGSYDHGAIGIALRAERRDGILRSWRRRFREEVIR